MCDYNPYNINIRRICRQPLALVIFSRADGQVIDDKYDVAQNNDSGGDKCNLLKVLIQGHGVIRVWGLF